MDRYTINCTSEQTKKALALGAPIDHSGVPFEDLESLGYSEYYKTIIYGIIPTAEQMIGWLRKEHGLFCEPYLNGECCYAFSPIVSTFEDGEIIHCEAKDSPEEATLAAIDAALEYLANNKQKE